MDAYMYECVAALCEPLAGEPKPDVSRSVLAVKQPSLFYEPSTINNDKIDQNEAINSDYSS